MRTVCIGGGPAGLYFAISVKLRNKDHDVTVIERNPPGETYGWGVVFPAAMINNLYDNDPKSALEICSSSSRWVDQEVHAHGMETQYIGGYGFSMGRQQLLEILAKRAMNLGAKIHFEREVENLCDIADADLIVACDGANSRVRHHYANHFQTGIDVGSNMYIWLGTHKVFDAFTFAFEETEAGWIWFHAYRFNRDTSTFIVECTQETWEGLGFDELDSDESIGLLEEIFKTYLSGYALINQMRHLGKPPWLNFRSTSNEKWYYNNVVLMGDAAHTTHFTIGSGTKLALQDAILLADKLHAHEDLQTVLEAYEEGRRADLLMFQRAARNSARWFENVHHHIGQDAVRFAYSLQKRRQGGMAPEEVPWEYRVRLATHKITALRRLRRRLRSARMELGARRRA